MLAWQPTATDPTVDLYEKRGHNIKSVADVQLVHDNLLTCDRRAAGQCAQIAKRTEGEKGAYS